MLLPILLSLFDLKTNYFQSHSRSTLKVGVIVYAWSLLFTVIGLIMYLIVVYFIGANNLASWALDNPFFTIALVVAFLTFSVWGLGYGAKRATR